MEHQKTEDSKALFSAWVSDPSGIGFADSREIEFLSGTFPFCQILQSLNAKALQKQSDKVFNSALAKASLYSPNRRVLFTLLNQPGNLKPVETISPVPTESYYEVIEEDDYAADLVAEEVEEAKQADFTESHINLEDPLSSGQLIEEPSETAQAEENLNPKKEIVEINSMDEEGKMIIENIASADFFAFEEKLDLVQHPEIKETDHLSEEGLEHAETRLIKEEDTENKEVARYDDESMPYSFLWWLHKTRQEHADTYQPYVDFKLDTNKKIKKRAGPELNQQIIENIFHLQSPLDEMENKPLPQTIHFEVKRKEEEIIEKFIREEPQIQPPSPDKLDMENKARKSAEDPNDLVSETLATIYTEQMLFHKAIDTYQKLSLKFPEKRAYFADQISELQKKIN